MKAITILPPFPALIPLREKHYETRGWKTSYRGPLAIHVGQSLQYMKLAFQEPFKTALQPIMANGGYNAEALCLGHVIAIVDLVECLKVVGRVTLKIGDEKRVAAVLENGTKIYGNELAFGDYSIGRYAWKLKNVRRIKSVPAKGMQRLWEWEP
ncbi:MAG: hypothetical protein H6Q72_1439 [Firmicutes bacterium]|nr:hypothetical protein [Bacillota bacterium]